MKRFLSMLALVAVLTAAMAAPVFAHTHGITPLGECSQPNGNAGGNGTNGTPADDGEGGPIAGLIPRDTGNAPLNPGDGGNAATDCSAP